jgi:predicted PurR-regulated permease PerM
VVLPLLLLTLLIALCVQLLLPFVGLLVWTIILGICFYPLHQRLMAKRGSVLAGPQSRSGQGSRRSFWCLLRSPQSALSSIPEVVAIRQAGDRQVPPPPARLKDIPVVGDRAFATWTQASTDMPAFAKKYGAQIATFTKTLVGMAAGLFGAVLALVLAIVFAAICLAYSVRSVPISRGYLRASPVMRRAANITWKSFPRR